MKLSELIPSADQLKLIQGVEGELLRRRRAGAIGGIVAIVAAVLQVLIAAIEQDYLENIGKFFDNLIHLRLGQLIGPQGLSVHELTGVLVLATGLGAYFLFRRTSFLFKESEEPFQYTFWIDPFEPVSGTPGPRFKLNKDDQFHLLAYDLMERLSNRIRRLSLLNVAALDLPANVEETLTSHIHISGHYTTRERKDGNWVIHIMPRIRVGPPSRPEALADLVEYPLTPQKLQKRPDDKANPSPSAPQADAFEDQLDADRYDQIVERVYSRIATEVYRQILADVREKIKLYPTSYLRAMALFHEAKDFERSNTIDAYDYAIDLYRESTRYFDIGLVGSLSRFALKLPLFWRLVVKYQLMESRARRGLARSLIYRRIVAALSGRSQNTLFEIPDQLEKTITHLTRLHNQIIYNKTWSLDQSWDCHNEHVRLQKLDQTKRAWPLHLFSKIIGLFIKVISPPQKLFGQTKRQQAGQVSAHLPGANAANNVNQNNRYKALMAFLTFPRDSLFRRARPIFDGQREALFDTYTVAALAYAHLGAAQEAKCFLDKAKALAPDLSQNNAPWLLAAAEIETDIDQKLLFLRRSTEMAADFEVAQYRLAYFSEMRLRLRDELEPERVENVIKEYNEVLRINPGNIGALAAQGYLWWLLGDLPKARKKFEEGSEIKAIVRQTFIGDLNYGLARIAAEEGQLNQSYNFYTQAVAADPGVAAYSNTISPRVVNSYYNYIVPDMLHRYEIFKTTVEGHIKQHTRQIKEPATAPAGEAAASGADKTLAKVRTYLMTTLHSPSPERKNGQEEVSEKMLKAVYSFVLNDYGNACLNYFHRFGDYKTLEQAITAFKTATGKNSENFVAYYNLHNAYLWRREPSNELILNCLAMAEKLAPAWPTVLTASAQYQMREIRNLITTTKKEKDEELEALKKAEDRLKKIRETAPQELLEAKDSQASLHSLAQEQTPEQAVVLKNAQDKIREHQDKVKNLDKKIKKLQDELQQEVFPKIGRILNQTKLSSLFEINKIDYAGQSGHDLFTAAIERDKLDENDIDALRVWAEVLSYNIENPQALAAAENLCHLIQHYYPRSFDTDYILYELYSQSKEAEKRNRYSGRLKSVIADWLTQDRIHFASLKWATEFTEFFNDAERTRFLQEAIDLAGDRDIYHSMLGYVFYRQGNYAKAITEYERAIEINPEDDSYFNMLGNTYFALEDYEQAITSYQKAITINSQAAVYHSNLARAYREIKAWQPALAEHRQAIEIQPEWDDHRYQLKTTLNAEGNDHYAQADYGAAIKKYQQALEIDATDAVIHSNLSLAWENLKEPGTRIEALDKAMVALQKALKLRPDDKDYQERLERLEGKKRCAIHFGEKVLDWYPVVTPIAVEVAANLIPYVESKTGGLEATLTNYIVNMRSAIDTTMGVRIPGIRFRGNETDMPPGSYLIMIREVPLVMGAISEGKRLFPGPTQVLEELGVVGEPALNPLTNHEEAVWVSEEDFEKVTGAGFYLWGFIEYPVRHLEAVIRQNLAEFLGHQEVINLLRTLPPALYQPLADAPAAVSLLTSVLKGLLNERVPITAFAQIVAKFHELQRNNSDLLTMIETMRRLPEICPSLPGNNDRFSFYRLGKKLEAEIRLSIYRSGSQPVLAMEPERCQDILSLIRQKLGAQWQVAILVEDESLRPFVYELVKIEWPQVPVLSRIELGAGLDSRMLDEIELAWP